MTSEPLEAWVEEKCQELGKEIMDTMIGMDVDDREGTWRCIMISVRQHWPLTSEECESLIYEQAKKEGW